MNPTSESLNPHDNLYVKVATIGYCWGIDLAMKRIAQSAIDNKIQATHRWSPKPEARRWDPLEFVRQKDAALIKTYPGLEQVEVINKLSDVTANRLALGHHGTIEPISHAGEAQLLDFTCPFIANSEFRAHMLAEAGYDLILFGKPGNHHCEFAKSLAEAAGRVGLIGESVVELQAQLQEPERNWACLGQVTANIEIWTSFKNDLSTLKIPVHIVDTVCSDSHDRQTEGLQLAQRCDVVILVNDHGGSTLSMFERCQAANPNTFRFDPMSGEELNPDWFDGAHSVAVVGGIHVPNWILDDVGVRISRLQKTGHLKHSESTVTAS